MNRNVLIVTGIVCAALFTITYRYCCHQLSTPPELSEPWASISIRPEVPIHPSIKMKIEICKLSFLWPSAPPGKRFASPIFAYSPHGLTFASQDYVTITLPFDEKANPDNINVYSFDIIDDAEDNEWYEIIDGRQVDLSRRTISVKIRLFCSFTVLEDEIKPAKEGTPQRPR